MEGDKQWVEGMAKEERSKRTKHKTKEGTKRLATGTRTTPVSMKEFPADSEMSGKGYFCLFSFTDLKTC